MLSCSKLQTEYIHLAYILNSQQVWVYEIRLIESELYQHFDKKPKITNLDIQVHQNIFITKGKVLSYG